MVSQAMQHGAYNENSLLQARGAAPALSSLQEAAASMPLPDSGGVLHLADLGCSQGRNSMEPLRVILRAVAARLPPGQRLSVVVAHEDVPSNDFKSLFNLLEQPSTSYLPDPATCVPSELQLDVFPAAIGRSFYKPLFPPASVHLAYCATALHWMSNVPIRPTDAVHAYLSELPAVVAAAREQGRLDIRTFLCRRAVELRPGAPLLFHLPVMGQEADAKPVPHVFVHRAVRAMLVDGRLKGEEAAAMTAHEFYRPAADVVGELAAAAGDWHVRRAEEISVELPGYAELARGEYTAERVAALTVDMLRAAFTDIYVAGLSASRPAAEAAQVVEALFAQAQALATTTPGAVAVHWLYVWLVRK